MKKEQHDLDGWHRNCASIQIAEQFFFLVVIYSGGKRIAGALYSLTP